MRSLVAQSSSDSFLNALMPEGSAALDDDPLTRTVSLGRFEMRGLLGAGGMGQATERTTRASVATWPSRSWRQPSPAIPRAWRASSAKRACWRPSATRTLPPSTEWRRSRVNRGRTQRRSALVLELVEGETLAERLRRERMSVSEAIDIARQIADALEAAYEKGVVHRDLKPANIKIRLDGLVKVLDFGLAKADALGADSAGPVHHDSAGETAAGMVLGTPAYMSPKQARGLAVDKRTDVWAFGCVLFEMLSGRTTFAGETTADIIASVLARAPDWNTLPERTPPAVQRLLQRCLEKNPRRRLRDMGDARLELDDSRHAPPESERRPDARRTLLWASATGAAVLASTLAVVSPRPQAPPAPVQFTLRRPRDNSSATWRCLRPTENSSSSSAARSRANRRSGCGRSDR